MFAKKIGIDLGTSSIRIYVRGEGIVMDEPSVAAVDGASRLLAVGRQAQEMAVETPGTVRLVRPIRDAGIADHAVVEQVLLHLVGRAQGRQRIFRPEVMMCVPSAATGRHRRAMTEAGIAAGARQAWLIEAPLAAAMGLGLPVAEAQPHIVCELGGGLAQAAVISGSGIVVSQAAAAGGEHLDEEIAALVRERHGLLIDQPSAEGLKLAVGTALSPAAAGGAEVTGRDAAGGAERTVVVTAAEVAEAIQGPLATIAAIVREVLDQTPPRLAARSGDRGVHLTGGGALLPGLDRRLALETGLQVQVAEDPRTCAVRGTRRALGEFEVLQRRQLYLR